MKKVGLGLALGLGLLMGAGLTASVYAAAFEGEVDYNLTSSKGSGTMVYLIKGKQIRVNTTFGGHEGDTIIDTDARILTTLMPTKKMYMTMALPPTASTASSQGKFTDTGRSAVIAGQTCEEWLYQGKSSSSSIWCAQGIGTFGGFSGKAVGANSDWAAAIKSKGLFPLKIVSKDASGNQTMTMEATKLAPQAEDDSLFQAPADYTKMDMGNLGTMMGK